MQEPSGFKPFVPADKVVPEFTITSVLLGALLAVVFGAANAYLGLRVGMTVAASIPAAVISMGVVRFILKKDSILENNMVQTIGSAGESVAAGAIFTLPAMFMLMQEWGVGVPSLLEIFLITFCGGTLGVLFMIPLRRALIVKEHGTLPYPEGTACSEVLLAGEEGGSKASAVFAGMGTAGLAKFLSDGLQIFPSRVHHELSVYKGAGIGVDVTPALLGVGYICGHQVASYMLAGSLLSWYILMPLLYLFGGETVIYPATIALVEMDSMAIWDNYIKYIGAGAIAAGGIISLIRSTPMIIGTFWESLKGYRQNLTWRTPRRTDLDLPKKAVLLGVISLLLLIWVTPPIRISPTGAIVIAIFGFFFATVSARMVGVVGSSNNLISGMTITTLIFSTWILKSTGEIGPAGMLSAIAVSSVICIIVAIAGDTSQDLKTGYILGATPRRQQLGELFGVLVASLTIGVVLYLLDAAWTFGSTALPAPQATLMKLIAEGVMSGNLPWGLIFAGIGIAITISVLRLPIVPFAVGLYLPVHLTLPIMIGGLVRLCCERRRRHSEQEKKDALANGLLYASGMIAGEGLVGVLLAVLAIIPFGTSNLLGQISLSAHFSIHTVGALIVLFLLTIALFRYSFWYESDQII
ncbi:MAG: oligopeptide transporter, OPT family [Anaerotruncus sp.]|nr:oligopeptide transporter, OPT family [Anaerotruncus sp.]